MQSDKIKNTEEKAEKTEVCEVTSEYKKQRFGLKIFPETLEIVDTLFKHDNCKSRSDRGCPVPYLKLQLNLVQLLICLRRYMRLMMIR